MIPNKKPLYMYDQTAAIQPPTKSKSYFETLDARLSITCDQLLKLQDQLNGLRNRIFGNIPRKNNDLLNENKRDNPAGSALAAIDSRIDNINIAIQVLQDTVIELNSIA